VKTAELGRTGLEISRVGFGAWAIGGAEYDWGWGRQDDEESIAAIHHALELGVNWIDTAAQYGFGHSEQVVGRALAGLDPRPLVFTKGGQPEGPGRTTLQSLKRDSLRREVEGSLSRLGVEAIDLYQIHWPSPDEEIEEGWAALTEFRDEGLDLPAREAEQRVRRAARGAEREELLASLEELASWYRDLVAAAAGAEKALVHVDLADALREDGTLERLEGAERAAELVRETWRRFEEFQLSPALALEALFVELRRAFAGQVGAPA